MPEKELLEQFNVSLCEFDSSQWPRDGFLDPVNRVVYINKDLPAERRLKVLLHELGHLEHNPKHYERLREKYEAQANRNMIHELLKNENLDDFNYLHFMEKYNLTTICDETFVKNEYLKLKEIEKICAITEPH
nr:MAG: IrrE N-terminal-like domain [Bacteriophage sp.]